MTKASEHIRTLAFEMPEELPWTGQLLRFPIEWREALESLRNRKSIEAETTYGLPIRSLNSVLRLLVADLICVIPGAGKNQNLDWLVSSETVDKEALALITRAWMTHQFQNAGDDAKQRAKEALVGSMLDWKTLDINLGDWRAGANGTALPSNPLLFNLVPALVANHLSQIEFDFRDEGKRFLRRAPTANGVELISWEPFWYEAAGMRYPWSIVFSLTVQTVAFQSKPMLYCNIGVRRWVIDSYTFFGKEKPSVYLSAEVPWLSSLKSSSSFQTTKVRWQYQDGDHPILAPYDQVSNILKTLQVSRILPDFSAVRYEKMIEQGIAVTFHTRMGGEKQRAGTGLMPIDRRNLFEQVAAQLSTFFPLAPQRQRKHVTVLNQRQMDRESNIYYARKPDAKKVTIADTHTIRRQGLQEVQGNQVVFEVLYQRDTTRDLFFKAIAEYLGLPNSIEGEYRLKDLTVTLRARLLADLGAELRLDSGIQKQRERLERAMDERVQEIASKLDNADKPTLTFVELQGQAHFEQRNKDADPKKALRRGLAYTGRHSQFFDADEEIAHNERAWHALLDGLRQWGLKPPLPQVQGVPSVIDVVGLWLINQNRRTSTSGKKQIIPVLVALKVSFLGDDAGVLLATAPGLGGWLPYPKVLLKLATDEATGFTNYGRVEQFIEEQVNNLSGTGDLLLLCHAQKMRQVWKFLQHSKLTKDAISFGDEQPRPIADYKGLRLVIIRASDRGETPEWYVEDKKGGGGFTKGIFGLTDRVFASTYGKAQTQRSLSKNSSKLGGIQETHKTHKAAPGSHAWNPALYEITVAAIQPGDDVAALATLTHELRKSSVQFPDATALPLPLHLADKMGEYIFSVELNEEGEEAENEAE